MHTLQINTEYDFAQQQSNKALRIGLFYNCQIAGKHTFKTNISGGSFGLDIAWDL